jgi:hypothetical protein
MRLPWWIWIPVAFDLAIIPAHGQIVWNFTFQDVQQNTGIGFADPAVGATRRDTLVQVTSYLNTVLVGNGRVDINVLPSLNTGSGSLATMGAFHATSPNQFSNGAPFEHATTGTDPFPGAPDAEGRFDFGYVWNSGTNLPAANQWDLFSVALHEMTHALGFGSLLSATGTSVISGGNPGVFSRFDSFLARGDGRRLFAAGNGGNFIGSPADLTSIDVFFTGSQRVKLYAPATFEPFSSLSHLDSSLTGVMGVRIPAGVARRTFADIELSMLRDIGWTVAIPEPGSLVLACGGGVSIVVVLRRCRRRCDLTHPTS